MAAGQKPWRYRMGERLLLAKISRNTAATGRNTNTGTQLQTKTSTRSHANASSHTQNAPQGWRMSRECAQVIGEIYVGPP
jgi:hypothetical protein